MPPSEESLKPERERSQMYSPLGLLSPVGNMVASRVYLCFGCGSVVFDMQQHDRWHRVIQHTLIS